MNSIARALSRSTASALFGGDDMQKETFSETAYTTILKDNDMPESYRVELIDTKTGECHVNIFSGGNSELRAKFFMSSYYPDVKINEMPNNGVKPTYAKRVMPFE